MRKDAVNLLRELTEAHSVPGHEEEVRAIFAKRLKDAGTLSTDRNGSVICDAGGKGPRVVVAGHMDEVGFMVQSITPEGFLRFVPIGGWWAHNLLAQRVEVKTSQGRKILGVIASTPPHFLEESQRHKLLPLDHMFIDVGARSREDAIHGLGIALGDPIAPVAAFTPMASEDLFMAKAFDNRLGMAATIQAGLATAKQPRPNHLLLAGTTQEEIGLRGARTASHLLKPDVAIILEGPPADDSPGFNRAESQGRLGGGAQIRMFDPSAISNPRLARFVCEVAAEENIPFQITVRRGGGTDAGAFHLAYDGIPCVVIGTPARYIHSHNAIMDLHDYLAMVALVTALVARLDAKAVKSFTKFL